MTLGDLLIRLYLDHNVDTWLVPALRQDGYDVVFAYEVGNAHLADEEQLRWATAEGRAVFTYDRKDYLILARDLAIRGEPHGGIIISLAPPVLPTAEILGRLRHFLNTITADELRNQTRWLDAVP